VELTPDDVRDVLRALDSSGLDELHLELTDLTLTVRREGASGWTAEQTVLRRPAVVSGTEAAAAAEPDRPRAAVPEGMVAVHPPLVGTFYRAPKPGAPPFVGIVETMKMMTPVRAGVRGTVAEFRIGNGDLAGTDAVLLVVDPGADTTGPGEGSA
jgi:acetyl-CoA carboxylase biotin carboxyl carrier protein